MADVTTESVRRHPQTIALYLDEYLDSRTLATEEQW
jgi:hypothetical protein